MEQVLLWAVSPLLTAEGGDDREVHMLRGSQPQGQCPFRAITPLNHGKGCGFNFYFFLNLLKLQNIKLGSNDFPPHVTFKLH